MNIEKIETTSVNINESPISVSFESGSIAIGQICYLTVTIQVTAPKFISINNIDIKDPSGKIKSKLLHPWKVGEQEGTAVFLLNIQDDGNINEGDMVGYTVTALDSSGAAINDIKSLAVSYKVVRISNDFVIPLETRNEYISPAKKNLPVTDDSNNSYIKYSGKVLDYKNNKLGKVQIIISSSIVGKLINPELVRIASEPDPSVPASKPQLIPIISEGGTDFFLINSDANGYVKFRVYSNMHTEVRVDFKTEIRGVTDENYAASIYVFQAIDYFGFGPASPNIEGIGNNGILKKLPGKKEFQVSINPYSGYTYSDSLIFFYINRSKNNEITQMLPIYKLEEISSLETARFSFMYEELALNDLVGLYYMIAPVNGDPSYSIKSRLMYVGNSGNSPDNDDGIYDKVKVYTSYAATPIKPTSDDDVLYETGSLTLDAINQLARGSDPTGQKTGLYVVIEGTKNNHNNELPPVGSTYTLNMQLVSRTRNVSKTYTGIVGQDQKNYTTIEIPYCQLTRAESWHNGIQGRLYFSYSVEVNGVSINSKTWGVDAYTGIVGVSSYNDGCPTEHNFSN